LPKVITYYLEMKSNPGRGDTPDNPGLLAVQQVKIASPEYARFLYTAVGHAFAWKDRLSWHYADWQSYLSRPELELWVAYTMGAPVGYFELERQAQGSVEIAIFGLLPDFRGQGVGRYLLEAAIERAWRGDTRRVWVHTCTLDHEHALPNYVARGFQVFKQEESFKKLSTQSLFE
jgi:GNAT superfamily N-acetyltransferase